MLKSSKVPIGSKDLWFCPNAGSSSAPSLGSIAAEDSPRIGRTSTARRSRSCASPQSASCSENSVINAEVSGRTLRNCEAECLGGLEVDDQLELGRQQDRSDFEHCFVKRGRCP